MTISNAQKPDLDWSQVRETVRMMNLAVAQIEMSMTEGDDSVDTLTTAFTTMADRVQVIESLVHDKNGDEYRQIAEQCNAISTEMQHAIMAFQFYDKLTQRLSHVSHSLGSLVDLIGDNSRLYNPVEWSILQEKIKSRYTMPAEHNMFELMMSGMSIQDVLQQMKRQDTSDDDVELF
jgi:hypothetical protein